MSNETASNDRMRRMMLIGRSKAGKTTLCQRINHEDLHYHKTQTVQVINNTMIDTPGEYLERFGFRGALIVTSADAGIIVFVQAATEQGTMFPPLFSSMFGSKSIIGAVTKCDIATEEQKEKAAKYLTTAGAKEIFFVSSYTGEGVPELLERIQTLGEEKSQ
jgi:ethanolamine utilization protein EutP